MTDAATKTLDAINAKRSARIQAALAVYNAAVAPFESITDVDEWDAATAEALAAYELEQARASTEWATETLAANVRQSNA